MELQRELDLDTKSVDSSKSYDSQFSETYPPALKSLHDKIKKLKGIFVTEFKEAPWKRFTDAFRVLSEPRPFTKHITHYHITE